ncbi:MAG: hypothetical protein H8K09_16670 [Nitrospira sp.]|nr:hypothetical protein [Nitrospira sp.]
MKDPQTLQQVGRRIILYHVGTTADGAAVADSVALAFEKFLTAMSSLIGHAGSQMVFRRSLKLIEATYPWFQELRRTDLEELTAGLATSLKQQSHDEAVNASTQLFLSLLELFALLIGERLIQQVLRETWPDILAPSQ